MGFTARFAAQAAAYEGCRPGRVLSQYGGLYRVMCEGGERLAEVSGRFRFEAQKPADYPAVGDFVMLGNATGAAGNAVIHHLLPRKSAFVRKAAGGAGGEQVVASNIDTVFLCMAMQEDFNLRRLERYLAVAWDSGAAPVVVLTKADLCDDVEARREEARAAAGYADLLVTSALDADAPNQLARYIAPGQTVAFIGSSGVGKSTLINRLLGEEKLETGGLRGDGKGRHTTTRRELVLLAGGGMVIDTPGMRELGLESADLSRAFADIDALAGECKYANCTHTAEPGCAVQAALAEGALAPQRLASYQKLQKEARYEGLNARQIETAKLTEMFREVGGMKKARKLLKEKKRDRF